MSWKLNDRKLERVTRFGSTVDLPLFDPKTELEIGVEPRGVSSEVMPSRIYDASQNKARILAAIAPKLTKSRLEVFLAIFDLVRATDRQIADRLAWEINRVIPRRKELQKMGLVQVAGEVIGEYGHPNTTWTINTKSLNLMLE